MDEFNFTPGTIIDARGQIGVIVDVLRSATTQNVVLYVRFVHNIGNARQHDALELTPERITALGVPVATVYADDRYARLELTAMLRDAA